MAGRKVTAIFSPPRPRATITTITVVCGSHDVVEKSKYKSILHNSRYKSN